jgi:putative hemolysin
MEYIDISKIIRESDSKFLKRLPSFVIGILKRVIREKEMNRILAKCEHQEGYPFLVKMIEEFALKLEIEGLENLPPTSRCIFAANHPFGIADGLILTHTVAGKYGSLKAIGNDAFMFLQPLRPYIFAVNVFGMNTKECISALDELYTSDTAITHFPAGEVSRRYSGKIQDCAWQKSFVSKAVSHKRDIVPIHFFGKNSRLFYFVSGLRKLLGIKLTLELILLPHEMFNKRGKTIHVAIGRPIPYSTLDKRFTHQEWTKKIREYTYLLGSGKTGEFSA